MVVVVDALVNMIAVIVIDPVIVDALVIGSDIVAVIDIVIDPATQPSEHQGGPRPLSVSTGHAA